MLTTKQFVDKIFTNLNNVANKDNQSGNYAYICGLMMATMENMMYEFDISEENLKKYLDHHKDICNIEL